MVNFSKNLLVGCGGSLLFVADRKQFFQAINIKIDASYYENDYTHEAEVTDYQDCTVGFDRRLNFFKLYFLFKHYGLKKLRALIRQIEHKTRYFRSLVNRNQIFLRCLVISLVYSVSESKILVHKQHQTS